MAVSLAARFADPDIAIAWPVSHADIALLDAVRGAPQPATIETGF